MTAGAVDAARSIRDDGIVCCVVGEEQYALRGADVRQIARVEEMHAEAGSHGQVGTLDVAGQTVPVFGLGHVLARPTVAGGVSHPGGRHIAVTGAPGELVGWLVDHVARTPVSGKTVVVRLPAAVGTVATTWFEALVKLGKSSVLLLAPHNLDPLARRARAGAPTGQAVEEDAQAFHRGSPGTTRQVKPMMVIFSTPALPPCKAPRYALSGRQIAAVVQPLPPIVVPGSAPHVTGVVWWRDQVVPVVDFRSPDNRDQTAPRRRCIIAQCGSRLGGTLVAFAIDPEIALHWPAEDDQLTTVGCPAFSAGLFAVSGDLVALVDLDALLGEAQ